MKKEKYLAKSEAKHIKIALQESIRLEKLEKTKTGNDNPSSRDQQEAELSDAEDSDSCTHKNRRRKRFQSREEATEEALFSELKDSNKICTAISVREDLEMARNLITQPLGFSYEKRSKDAIRENSRRVNSEIRKLKSIGFIETSETLI